jgi:hypothetical protein
VPAAGQAGERFGRAPIRERVPKRIADATRAELPTARASEMQAAKSFDSRNGPNAGAILSLPLAGPIAAIL